MLSHFYSYCSSSCCCCCFVFVVLWLCCNVCDHILIQCAGTIPTEIALMRGVGELGFSRNKISGRSYSTPMLWLLLCYYLTVYRCVVTAQERFHQNCPGYRCYRNYSLNKIVFLVCCCSRRCCCVR